MPVLHPLRPAWLSLLGLGLSLVAGLRPAAAAAAGADIPWITHEAEAMRTTGVIVGPGYAPHTIETESSHQTFVSLTKAGDHLEFDAGCDAQALVVRYSLPDAPEGGGTSGVLRLWIAGKPAADVAVSSRDAWLYGTYPFSNDPRVGKPRNFYDEARVGGLRISPGDVVRLELISSAGPCAIDLVDLEEVPAPREAAGDGLSVLQFGAAGDGSTDDTAALRAAVAVAHERRGTVWVPPGRYRITGDIEVPDHVTIQGAGMWHTTFVGDEALYARADRRVRFRLKGRDNHLADFAIVGALNYRDDQEPNDGIVGAGCAQSTVSRIWIEHTKVGVWIYNGADLRIEGCRFRNMLADGGNLCVGTTRSVVENCTARGTGDDCFAIWPAASDQGFDDDRVVPGGNIIRRCTGQLTFLANGIAVYGGADNRVEDCLLTDIGTGCGILISTTFPTADEARGIDNNFSGTTTVRNCVLLRCGGWDHSWTWRGAFQICMDRRSISGLVISDVEIRDSFSDGLTVVAPGSVRGQGTLSGTRVERLRVAAVGLGAPDRAGLRVRDDAHGGLVLVDSDLPSVRNRSSEFEIQTLRGNPRLQD